VVTEVASRADVAVVRPDPAPTVSGRLAHADADHRPAEGPHPARVGESGAGQRMVVRVLRWIGAVAGAVAAVLLLALVVLVVANPEPRPAPAWERLPDLPGARGEVAATAARVGGGPALVVAGGYTGLTASASTAVHAYVADERRWRELPDLPEARHHAAATALGGDVYVGGGAPTATDRTAQATLWVLREGGAGWEPLAPMPEGREGHRMRALGGRLYVVGGRGASADVLAYDPGRDRWTRGPALPRQRHHLGLVVREGRLWAIGGRTDDNTLLDVVHTWRPGDAGWREGPRLPRAVSAAAEAVVDGTIHLVGGEDPALIGGGIIDAHLTLAQDAERWEDAPPAPVAVHGAAGAELRGRLVVAGGSRRQGLLSPLAWTDLTAAHAP
jgi:hypothetical protein